MVGEKLTQGTPMEACLERIGEAYGIAEAEARAKEEEKRKRAEEEQRQHRGTTGGGGDGQFEAIMQMLKTQNENAERVSRALAQQDERMSKFEAAIGNIQEEMKVAYDGEDNEEEDDEV